MKIHIELNMPDDRVFLNYWDSINGDDVTCQLIDGNLMLSQYNEHAEELPPKEITLTEFLEMVRKSVDHEK